MSLMHRSSLRHGAPFLFVMAAGMLALGMQSVALAKPSTHPVPRRILTRKGPRTRNLRLLRLPAGWETNTPS